MIIKTYATLILSAFFWGASAIAGKYALQVYTPSIVTFLRFFVAALIMLLLVWKQRKTLVPGIHIHLRLFIIALTGVSLCYYFYFNGLYASTAFNAGIIEATIPLLTLLLATLCRMEKVSRYQITGLVMAYFGVMITITDGDWRVIVESSYNTGDILLLLSTVCFGVYNILTRRWQMAIPGKVFMFWFFFYGSLALVPWLIIDHAPPLRQELVTPLLALAAIIFMSLGGSVIAYFLFNQGIAEIGASRAASFINLVPVITVFLSVFVLKEQAGIFQWTGAIVILTGVCIANGLHD